MQTTKQLMKKLGKFSEDEINAILEHTTVETFKKGNLLARQGITSDTCYFVLEGCLRQYLLVDGEEKTTAFFLEGQSAVLYSSYLKQTPSDYFLVCLEDCTLLAGTREQEHALHKKYPKLENLTYSFMLQDYDKAANYIALLNNYKPEDRYLTLLETQPELFNRVPLHHIASFLGITPESFSRIRKRIRTGKAAVK